MRRDFDNGFLVVLRLFVFGKVIVPAGLAIDRSCTIIPVVEAISREGASIDYI